ncbi:hypothetical protein A6M21_13720 [Desulfotomaculum copahuensis]|uniref:Pyrrolo-quinoline quinone repeat domain-containing protein n=1 Tax=Desulfotomaculum copahuensis TaxID=1838280 RepID=A0A1B7LC85_9FIRM|nr:hypothetical protein A6M21_13720 [Desulfotomaculum copahuensis]
MTGFPAAGQAGQPVRLLWQLAGLGRPSADMLMGTNGLLYLPEGNKLTAVNTDGRPVWEAPLAVGNQTGRPVFGPAGSIFMSGNAAVQEIKTSGAAGWSFQVYQGAGGGNTAALLCGGPGDGLLYLPLPDALYALNVAGRYKWALLSWNAAGGYTTKTLSGQEILDCAGDSGGVYVIYGRRGDNYTLAAIDAAGNIRWTRPLGDVKSAHLFAGGDGRLYVTVNPAQPGRIQKSTVYAFDPAGDGQPEWSFRVNYDDLTTPALSAAGVLYVCDSKRLYALDARDGTEKWDLQLLNITSEPVVDDTHNLVYVGSRDGYVFALDASGKTAWERKLDGAVSRRPLVGADGYLYVITDRGSLYKLAPA